MRGWLGAGAEWRADTQAPTGSLAEKNLGEMRFVVDIIYCYGYGFELSDSDSAMSRVIFCMLYLYQVSLIMSKSRISCSRYL